jgi:hypothetical protein
LRSSRRNNLRIISNHVFLSLSQKKSEKHTRHRIRHTARTRINPKPLNPPIKLLLLLIHLRLKLPISQIEDAGTDNRTCEPANSAAGEGYETECDEGIERYLGDESVHVGTCECLSTENETAQSGSDRGAQLVPSACLAEFEEGVPVQVVGGFRACCGGFVGRRCAD